MASLRARLQSFRSSTAFITFVIAYAVFTDQFLFAAIIPVYPTSLQTRVGIPKDRVQTWVSILLGIFGIANVITAIPWGWYTDRSKSRSTPFMIGLFALFGATLVLWFTTTIAGQVVGRALQGISSIIVWTTGLAVLVDTVGEAQIGKYMGHICIALNMGSLVAPLLGGIVFTKSGYHATFGMIIGIIVLDIVLRAVMVEQKPQEDLSHSPNASASEVGLERGDRTSSTRKEKKASTNVQITSTSSLSVHIPPINDEERQSPINPEQVQRPRKSKATIISRIRNDTNIRLICSVRFIATLWGIMVLATVFSGFQATLPLFVEHTFGWDAIGGGLIFIPLSLPAFLGPVVGEYTDRKGGRWFATAGFLLFTVSLVCLRFVTEHSTAHIVLLCALLLMVGSCMALIMEPVFKEITYGGARLQKEDVERGKAPGSYYGAAYAWFNIAWCTGNFVGPIAGGFIYDSHGWDNMSWALGLLSGVSAFPVALWCGGWLFEKKNKTVEKPSELRASESSLGLGEEEEKKAGFEASGSTLALALDESVGSLKPVEKTDGLEASGSSLALDGEGSGR